MSSFGELMSAATAVVGDNAKPPAEIKSIIEQGDVLVLDVQDPGSEFALPGAVNISLGTLPFKVIFPTLSASKSRAMVIHAVLIQVRQTTFRRTQERRGAQEFLHSYFCLHVGSIRTSASIRTSVPRSSSHSYEWRKPPRRQEYARSGECCSVLLPPGRPGHA